MGLTAISRPPANYLEYIEAEQEHLPANSRQKFTIFSAPLPAPTEITLGLTTTDHGVGGGWKECFEQYPACKQSASTIRPGCSSGWDSPLSKDTRQWSAGRLNQPVVHARLRCGGSEGKGSGREHARCTTVVPYAWYGSRARQATVRAKAAQLTIAADVTTRHARHEGRAGLQLSDDARH